MSLLQPTGVIATQRHIQIMENSPILNFIQAHLQESFGFTCQLCKGIGLSCSVNARWNRSKGIICCNICEDDSCVPLIMCKRMIPKSKLAVLDMNESCAFLLSLPATVCAKKEIRIIGDVHESETGHEMASYINGLKTALIQEDYNGVRNISDSTHPLIKESYDIVRSTYQEFSRVIELTPEEIMYFMRAVCYIKFKNICKSIKKTPVPPENTQLFNLFLADGSVLLVSLYGQKMFILLDASDTVSRHSTIILLRSIEFWAILVILPTEDVPRYISCSNSRTVGDIMPFMFKTDNLWMGTYTFDPTAPQYPVEKAIEAVRLDNLMQSDTVSLVAEISEKHVLILGNRGNITVGNVVGPPTADTFSVIVRWGNDFAHFVTADICVMQVGGCVPRTTMPTMVCSIRIEGGRMCQNHSRNGDEWTCIGYRHRCRDIMCACKRF